MKTMKTTPKIECYVINLPRDGERRERMEALLGGLGIDFAIRDAVVGRDLSVEQLAFFENRAEMKLLPAEFGCLMSHVDCWRSFVTSHADLALVCEDDIHVSPDIRNCLAALEFPDDGPAIVRLESFGSFTTFSVRPRQKIGRYGIHRMFTDHGGTAGYLIDKKTANYLLDAAPRFRNAIDIEMFFPTRSSIPDIAVYQFIPALVIQDQILTQNRSVGYLKSNMGDQRADQKLWNKRNVLQRLKGWSRPYYQAVYSAFLRAFADKMRLIVPFR
jgi:glycosyl transferase family 25